MKKVFNISKLLLLVSFMLVGFNMNAADCSKATDKFCEAMSRVTKQVKLCKDFNDFENLDFNGAINSVDMSDIPDECSDAPLTAVEKTKIKNSCNSFLDAMVDKTYELAGGMISKADINAQFAPMRSMLEKAINQSSTLNELGRNMSQMF